MLSSFKKEMRAAAAQVAEAERLSRRMVGDVAGREEKYTEVFRTHLEVQLDGFSDGFVSWKVVTYTTDKQSGQETRTGADIVIAVDLTLNETKRSKGFLVQAKVNKNVRQGVSVDSVARLREQCDTMTSHTKESYVFAYGNQGTKVFKASDALTGMSLSKLPNKSVGEFFGDVMLCKAGDPKLVAHSHLELEKLVREMESRSGVLLRGTTE